jgi:hypothetical protein
MQDADDFDDAAIGAVKDEIGGKPTEGAPGDLSLVVDTG